MGLPRDFKILTHFPRDSAPNVSFIIFGSFSIIFKKHKRQHTEIKITKTTDRLKIRRVYWTAIDGNITKKNTHVIKSGLGKGISFSMIYFMNMLKFC